jgi:hypothetical protein
MIITATKEQIEEGARNYWTLEAMRKFGGGFVKSLGHAGAQADKVNLERLKRAWPEYWAEYAHMGESLRRKKEAGA